MTMTEITTRAYWAASKALTARQTPADRAMLVDTLGHIALHAPERIAKSAARRLEREGVLGSDGAFDFNGDAA